LIFISLLKADLALKETKMKKKVVSKTWPFSGMKLNQRVDKSDIKSTQGIPGGLQMVKTGAIE